MIQIPFDCLLFIWYKHMHHIECRDQYIYPFTCVIFILDGDLSEACWSWQMETIFVAAPSSIFFFSPLFLLFPPISLSSHPCLSRTMSEISTSENSFWKERKDCLKSTEYYILRIGMPSLLTSSAWPVRKYQWLKIGGIHSILHFGHGHKH